MHHVAHLATLKAHFCFPPTLTTVLFAANFALKSAIMIVIPSMPFIILVVIPIPSSSFALLLIVASLIPPSRGTWTSSFGHYKCGVLPNQLNP